MNRTGIRSVRDGRRSPRTLAHLTLVVAVLLVGGPYLLGGGGGRQVAGEPSPDEEDPVAASIVAARTYIAAMERATAVETKRVDLEVRVVFHPDVLRWRLLRAVVASVEAEESVERRAERLAAVRKKWRKLAGRPGFEVQLSHTVETPAARSETRTIHLFPADPEKLLAWRAGRRAVPWETLGAPEGLDAGRVRLAKHYRARHGRQEPFVAELEPKRPRLVLDGPRATILGALPERLLKLDDAKLYLSLAGFERFRGPSPEPLLLDRNDAGSSLDRELELSFERTWPPPWPPLPASVAALIGVEGDGDSD